MEEGYIIPFNRPISRQSLHEFIHGPLQLRRIVRDPSFEMQRIERHAEFLTQTPEARETDGPCVEVVLPVVVFDHDD
jgi:hypothetical protein